MNSRLELKEAEERVQVCETVGDGGPRKSPPVQRVDPRDSPADFRRLVADVLCEQKKVSQRRERQRQGTYELRRG